MIGSALPCRLLRPTSLVALLGLSVVGGCGVDSYESRMKETIEDLRHENKFVGLSPKFMGLTFPAPPGTVPPEQVLAIAPRIRLPDRPRKFADTAYRPESQDPDNAAGRIPENRVFPPFPIPQIQGFQEEFEQWVNTSAGTRPWHLYVGVLRHPPGVAGQTAAYIDSVIPTLNDAIAKENADDAAAGAPPAPDMGELAWQNVTFLPARRGATPYTWKVLEFSRPQLFFVQGNVPTKVPGIVRMMVLDVPGKAPNSDHMVTLMWRFPANAGAVNEIKDLITASMGTFEIDPVAPAPAAPAAPAKPN